MDFDLGTAFAGVYMVGNYGADLHFRGGRYGIVTEKPSPAWSFTLVDSTFDGQRDAAIREHEAGLTLLNVTFRNTPVGIEIDRGYGDWLYGQRVRFENVSKAGGGGSTPRPAKITMFLTPSWKPGVLSPSISTGRVGPTPSRRTPGQT